MKKKNIIIIIAILGLVFSNITSVFAVDSMQEAKNAGYTEEEYSAIMAIPDLENEQIIEDTMVSRGNEIHDAIVNEAKRYLGVKYVWGGYNPQMGFDCSGLVQYVYKQATNINLPRVSRDQGTSGKAISLSNLQKGDLLFWTDNGVNSGTYHVAIYIGNGQMIHAPQPGETVKVANLSSFMPHYARRILPDMTTEVNNGYLENFNVSASKITLNGWHVADKAQNGPYSYIFIIDAITDEEIARYKINRTSRQDVANEYPNIANSKNSGFVLSVPTPVAAQGKTIKIISRYATDVGGSYAAVNYYFNETRIVPTDGQEASLDVFDVTASYITLSGWHATPNYTDGLYSYIFLIDTSTNKEITRYKINRTNRPDVGNAYPNIPNSQYSGFSLKVATPRAALGKNVRVISRYASDEGGNKSIANYNFTQHKTLPLENQKGSLDVFQIKDNKLVISGWHLSDRSILGEYSYIFIMDASNDTEITRYKINRTTRSDVATAYPDYPNASKAGFSLIVDIPKNAKGKDVRVVSRYTDNEDGNGGASSYYFAKAISVPN